jgi:NAD(P)-dependent dehydrogenase (short-subunit alcohol dehydrogenase family)
MSETKKVLVLGASGLIGRFVTDELRSRGLQAVGVARSYSASQRIGAFDLELPLLALDSSALAQMIGDYGIDVVVNCVGLLQDVPGNRVGAVHRDLLPGCCWRSKRAVARSGWCTFRSQAQPPTTAPLSAPPNARRAFARPVGSQ